MKSNQIIYQAPSTDSIISIEQYQKKQIRRRKHVARRWSKRFPLFAVEFTKEEFPDYSPEQLKEDLDYKRSKPQKRKAKSPLKRQGRYPMMQEALKQYRLSGDSNDLAKAQQLRKRLYCPFEVYFKVAGAYYECVLPSTAPLHFIKSLLALKCSSFEELEAAVNRILENARFVTTVEKIEDFQIFK